MPKIVDHEAYKKEMLEKSIAVFAEHGYSDISIRQLAERLNVSTGTLYHYFSSKEILFRELFTYLGKATLNEVVDDLCGLKSTKDKVDRLLDFFENRCSRMQSQFLLSADLIRNEIGESSEQILYEWASYMKRSLRLLIGLPADVSEIIYTFLSGALYASFLEPAPAPYREGRVEEGSDEHTGARFRVFKEMLLNYIETENIKGSEREIKKPSV